MPLVFPEPDRLVAIQLHDLAIDPDADKTFAPDLFDHIPELAQLILDQRSQQENSCFWFVRENSIDDLLGCLPGQRLPGAGIVGLTNCRKEHPQIIIDFSRGRDGRSGIRARTTLLDRDRRRKALDKINIRLLHLIEKLPRVCRETFHIAALAFSIERIKSERRFPGATQSGNDNQFLPGNLQVEVLQIVLACTTDLDNLRRHSDVESRTF